MSGLRISSFAPEARVHLRGIVIHVANALLDYTQEVQADLEKPPTLIKGYWEGGNIKIEITSKKNDR